MSRSVIILSFFVSFVIFSSCKNKSSGSSPFDEELQKTPFINLTDSIKKDPKNDELYFRRAVLLNANNLPEPALADFQKAWTLKKAEKYAFGLGNLLLEKKPGSAISFLQTAITELPKSFLLKLTLARALADQNNLPEALRLVDEMLSENPRQVDVLKMKADILDRQGDKKEAIATLENAYNLTPFDIELNYMLALRLAETGNSRVLSLCDSLISVDSMGTHAEPFYYQGIFYSTINDKAKALSFFDTAIKKDFYFLDGYIEKGGVLYDMKKYNEAITVFNLCLTVSPKFADAYYWIAKCQQAMGKNEDARVNYERAYSLDPTMIEAKEAADKLK